MYDINDVTIGRVNIIVALIMNEAVARGHKENGDGYTPVSRFLTILMDINAEVNQGVNERMNKILQEEIARAKLIKGTVEKVAGE